MKKVLAFLLATVMMLAMVVPTMAAAEQKTITVNGLEAGDTVKYYKVVEWAADGTGWKFVAPFDTALTADEKKEILGYVDATTTPPTKVAGKITDATAAKMGGAEGLGTPLNGANGETVADEATSWSATNLAPGLYMALITGAAPTAADGTTASPMHVYNPVFLAVQSDNQGTEITLPLSYPDNGTAKKTDVTVDKKAKKADGTWVDATSENVGDVIDFKVETTVPAYLESWTNPEFKVSDSLSTGLTFNVGANNEYTTLTVKAGDKTLEVGADKDYTITKNAADEWEISFTAKYLQGRTAAELVTITYQAKITSDAATVNPEKNTVKITYSNDPNDSSKHGEKEDKTTHYTFSIDADLFGGENYESSEIIKVGVDAAGNIITTTETTYDNGEKHMPLAGAEFKLYKADGTTPYTNENITAETVFVTNDEGKLMVKDGDRVGIHGLEEGTYVLKEVTPPAGYMLMSESVTFVIEAEYEDVAATATCNAYQQLKGYTVKVNGQTTSTYTMDNGTVTKVKLDDDGHAGDQTFEIKNTQGQGLPSTGGIGTTLFYIIGSILVIGAGIILVVRRRMSLQ